MQFGFAGPWYGEFTERDGAHPRDDEERLRRQLEFLVRFGFKSTGFSPRSWLSLRPEFRTEIGAFLETHDLHLDAHLKLPYFRVSLEELRDAAARAVDDLRAATPTMRTRLVHGAAGPVHRFMAEPSLEEQFDRLAAGLLPVAEACQQLDLALGIENHGDYYCSDLAELCDRVPGLGIFLDTGNTFLIGERPVPAYEAAAPHVVGGHLKDHHVHPDPQSLHFVLEGAALGEGEAQLPVCWDLLQRSTPAFETLQFDLEMIWDRHRYASPVDCLEASLAFVRSLP